MLKPLKGSLALLNHGDRSYGERDKQDQCGGNGEEDANDHVVTREAQSRTTV
jgi:hypothetical protein